MATRVNTLSLVVCTRNREADLARALPTFLANLDGLHELIVVDQSTTSGTRALLDAARQDPRVRYVPSAEVGLSRARNQGAAHADGSLVAYTDDDCLLPPDWARRIVEPFERERRLGAVFGRVDAVEHDAATGAIPVAAIPTDALLTHPRACPLVGGLMGASMVLRREALQAIGGFDVLLGAGAPLHSGEDVDAAYRVLRLGQPVALCASPTMWHFGLRSYTSGAYRQHLHHDMVGAGAYYGKHVRCGDGDAARLYAREWSRLAAIALRHLRTERRPVGAKRMASILAGFAAAWRPPLDRAHRLFLPGTHGG
jgi:GT2 family glycosyltransferase